MGLREHHPALLVIAAQGFAPAMRPMMGFSATAWHPTVRVGYGSKLNGHLVDPCGDDNKDTLL